jgi:uncharacterized membrane protein YeaQ/YmgE (transglycosylase-associated protein family)
LGQTVVTVLGGLLSTVLSGFLIGALARLALPGPDPMPFWFTVLVGLSGSLVGGAVAATIYGASHTFDSSSHGFVTLLFEVGAAIAILAAYRRFVQRRPLSGPDAYRFPSRGFGIQRMRARLRQLGVDPDRLSRRPASTHSKAEELTADQVADELGQLRDLHDKGDLSDEDYERAREQLRRY